MNLEGQGRRLETWSEIAEYLGWSVRKVQNDESKNGLPVHRYSGVKGRVFAFTSELDWWREQQIIGPGEKQELEAVPGLPIIPEAPVAVWGPGPLLRRRRTAIFAILGVAVAGLVFLGVRSLSAPGPPDHFEMHGRELRVFDDKDRIVWQKSMPIPWQWTPDDTRRATWFGQLDGIPGVSLIFPYHALPVVAYGTELQCYSQTGELKWSWHPGQAVSDGRRTYSPLYSVSNMGVIPGAHGVPNRIVVSSNHVESYPHQIAMLDSRGKVTGEYWHSGHLRAMTFADLNQDGRPEILLAGVDNGRHQATLVVLDPEHLGGASVQEPGDLTQLRGFAPAREKAIVRFPRDRMSRKLEEYARAIDVVVTPSEIKVQVSETIYEWGPYVIYRLKPNLDLISVEESDILRNRYQQLVVEGKLDHGFTDEDRAELRHIEVIRNQ